MNVNVAVKKLQRNAGVGRLSVTGISGCSMIDRLYQSGNAKIRVPGRHDNAALEAVMINIAGGMTGGDTLSWRFEASNGANLTVTTQACERIYSSNSGPGHVDVTLAVSNGARLNWLPQETIIFDHSDLERRLDVNLSSGAEALIVESFVFGRKAMGEVLQNASIKDRWRVRNDGTLTHAEDFSLVGNIHEHLGHAAIAGGMQSMTTLLMIAPTTEQYVKPLLAILGDSGSVSNWNGKLIVRILAQDSYRLRQKIIPVIELLSGDQPPPKCWKL